MSDITNKISGLSAIDMEVFSNRLLSVTDEMSTSLIKSSFSTNIKERKDCSVGLFDAAGRLIAQASNIPLHLGSLKGSVEGVLANFDTSEIHDGDAFVCNDPYLAGGTHTPDISIVTPIFHQGVLRFYAANIGHHTDVGGPSPGSTGPTLRSIFAEGLRIPVIKLVQKGELDKRLLHMISVNSRDPLERELDLKVQIATNDIGQRSLLKLVDREGIDTLLTTVDALLDYTQFRLAAAIQALKDGVYCGESFMDHDGLGGDKVRISVAVTVKGDRISFDFEGSSKQARGGYNVPQSALSATCYYAVKSLLDPGLPPNAGMFRVVDISAPQGTILNPDFPAATGSRSVTCQKVARAIFLALGQALTKDQIVAPSTDMNGSLVFSGDRSDGSGRFVYLETVGGGGGARYGRDGFHAIQVHITNSSNLPAEAMELEYPLLVRQYSLAETTTGAGEWCGGAGIIRDIISTAEGVMASVRSDGILTPAPGIGGGGDGGPARIAYCDPKGELHYSQSPIGDRELEKGAGVRLETPGGAGVGLLTKRPAEKRDFDRKCGFFHSEGGNDPT